MKKLLFFLAVILCTLSCFAQNQNSIIKTQAMEMVKALLKKDFPTFTRYVHPKIIEMAGGPAKAMARMDTVNAMATQFGAEIKKILIGNPGKAISYKNELQVVLPQHTEMKTGFGSLTLESTLIAISKDHGKNWTFIDTSVYNINDVKKALPDLSPDLVIPPAVPPKFVPDKK